MATNFYPRKILIGGTAGALDEIDGAGLNDLDFAIVSILNKIYMYSLDDDSAAAESSPNVIKPDANAGDKRWILQGIHFPSEDDAVTPTISLGNNNNDGIYQNVAGRITIATSGAFKWSFAGDSFSSFNEICLRNEAVLNINPIHVIGSDVDTGLGGGKDDTLSLIAGGLEGLRVTEVGGVTSVKIFEELNLISYESETVYFEDSAVFN